ncbi:unnamed protein product [Adineta steineri]|uniref:Uncharacterized protein n=1 Tax=Adineta steineri TaxID=433720 RepID=A0A813MD13_9BILA|nr:unnamed protein product [Adineta steineri]CAF3684637.1 unnamed protein product [Adineta steineri]
MATTTTLTSQSSTSSNSRELCIICEAQPYDLICTCGDKFDFTCIHQHVEQISLEFQVHREQVAQKLNKINIICDNENSHINAIRTNINDWKRKRIQDINDAAEKALNDVQQHENNFTDISTYEQILNDLSAESHRVVHDNLNKLIELGHRIQNKTEDIQAIPPINHDEASLDSIIQSKLHPSLLTTNVSSEPILNNQNDSTTSLSTPPTASNRHSPSLVERTESNTNELPSFERTDSDINASSHVESTISDTNTLTPPEPETESSSTTNENGASADAATYDEFDAGKTRHIQRINPKIIPTNSDKNAGTICCHGNQLLYNSYNQATHSCRLTFVPDLLNPTDKKSIDWGNPDQTINGDDDEWIQDIVYSDKLSGYLVLNRARLRLFKDDTNKLEEFRIFPDRTTKRLTCNEKFIYLTSAHGSSSYNGDEILLINYDKEEQLCKTFRDIMPSRVNRGSGQLPGEISDIAAGSNDQITIGYRFERRHEVGVCVFNVTNNGKDWSCIKQLLLNECWHSDLSYTPRIDWCEKLNSFILIEYMTGHLIMVDRDGQVEGECRFMQATDRTESPINLTISSNDWLCVRYNASITIHKIT